MNDREYDLTNKGLFIVFLTILCLFVYLIVLTGTANAQIVKSGITVKLLDNTNFCDMDCYSIYNICIDSKSTTSKISDMTFSFENKEGMAKILKQAPSLTILPNISYPNCYNVKINGKKGIFESIDNIPCIKDVCFKEYAWWNTSYYYRFEFASNITVTNSLTAFNFTNGINGKKDSYWILNKTQRLFMYCDLWNCTGNVKLGNETDLIDYENGTSRSGLNTQNVFENYLKMNLHYDELGDEMAFDSGQSSKHASLTGTYARNTSGYFNNGISFDGSSGYAYVSQANNTMFLFNSSGFFTLETWLKLNKVNAYQDILRVDWSGTRTWWIWRITDSNTIQLEIGAGNGANVMDCNSNTTLSLSTWYHLAAIYNSTSQKAKLYINGILRGDCSFVSAFTTTASCLTIMGDNRGCNSGVDDMTKGLIDETRIYLRDLSDSEIYEHANNYTYYVIDETYISPQCINTYNFRDDYSNAHISSLTIYCNNSYTNMISSPFYYTIPNGTAIVNCNITHLYYYNSTFSFECLDNSNHIFDYSLTFMGSLTTQEHNWLKLMTFLQSVKGYEIYPTNKTCVDNMTLKQEYAQVVCIDSSCNNLTIKQDVVPCVYGCITDVNSFNAECKQPDYIFDIIVILIIISVFVLLIWLSKRK